ncbi:hypothetical protein ACQP1O_42870 (plasmid) [Nocardia sp. CA-151230]|uniref:hypothetical protein n=1 Tax=Nocardia sp. CA-151230 TaxID=3239982 RepID=UPI003D9507B7
MTVDLPGAIAGGAITLTALLLIWALRFTERANARLNALPQDDDEDDVTVGDDPDRWRDYEEADRRGAL